ncbi:transmembrane and coiled-coil domain-containing protein 6 [Spea bombifrons]|uniref:transmembrane and coiled-coil domain-containing protein 6 n=1 Tax=Spea bombifrons TaxID=233779 RepID=UPI00234A31BD|nr:transmembrane and coiled-coil domain-containing protein 6 [Spea bombifrons]
MWRRRKVGCKSVQGLDELRKRRREYETALRKARREQQLISKRLLRDEPDDDEHFQDLQCLSEDQIDHIIKDLRHGPAERLESLITLRRYLQSNDVRLMFIRVEGSMQVLIGLFTCSFAEVQMEAARCLHELSQSDDPSVSKACLPATSYLLTYLSGNNPDFTELCLYTLGNIIVEGDATRNQLLLQGLIPALSLCAQSPHTAVLEALGYALSQLLQSKEASEKIIPLVLESGLVQEIFRLLRLDSEERVGAAVEFAWCLHYIVCSQVNNTLLISQGIVPKLSLLLSDLSAIVSKSTALDMELLICPLVRCVGNLLAEVDSMGNRLQIHDGRLLAALFVFMRRYRAEHPFLLPECLWALNNLTAEDPVVSSAVLHYNLLPALLELLFHSTEVTLLVLTVLCNIADLGPAYSQHLRQKNILPCVVRALGGTDVRVTHRSLEIMVILFKNCPDIVEEFISLFGVQILEPYKDHLELQQQVQTIWNRCQS